MTNKIKILFLIFIMSSCTSSFEKEHTWDKADLYKVKNIESTKNSDTTIVYINDHSFIYYDEYNIWKSNYFIWHNREKLRDVQILKIRSVQEGRDFAMDGIYLNDNINATINQYANNATFDSISHLVLSSFEPIEIMNLRNAHNYLNDYYKDYQGTFVDLLLDFSVCNDSCFASRRIKLIGEMLYEVKLDDYWHDNKKVDADDLILKLNKILRMKGVEEIKMKNNAS